MSAFLAYGYGVTHLSENQKPALLIHPRCREAFGERARKRGVMWVNCYHGDAPFDLVPRFAMCAQCNKAIR